MLVQLRQIPKINAEFLRKVRERVADARKNRQPRGGGQKTD
jgi:hypothetical protein